MGLHAQRRVNRQRPGTARAQTRVLSREERLYQEGSGVAKRFWDKRTAYCNGSYYLASWSNFYGAPTLFECKAAPKVEVTGETRYPRSLSEADRLNGVDPLPVEWQGRINMVRNTCRSLNYSFSPPFWNAWVNADYEGLALYKFKGVWAINELASYDSYFLPLNCSIVSEHLANPSLPYQLIDEAEAIPTNVVELPNNKVINAPTFGRADPILFFTTKDGVNQGKKYGTKFLESEARYIHWQLNVRANDVSDYAKNPIVALWYRRRNDGSFEKFDWSAQTGGSIERVANNIQLINGKGWSEPGNWPVGFWRVKLFQNTQLVALGDFELYNTGVAAQPTGNVYTGQRTTSVPREFETLTKQELYEKFSQNRTIKQALAYYAAREYLRRYSSDDDQTVQYLKKWVRAYASEKGLR